MSIRRGEFLDYFPEARQDQTSLLDWSVKVINFLEAKNVAIFSEDHKFRDEFKKELSNKIIVNYIDPIQELEPWERGYVEFLILSNKCKKIYGTPVSSFAEEAGIFSGKFHYDKTLSPLIETKSITLTPNMTKEILPTITIAILCKSKAHVLPLYLKCIEGLYYPKELINIYIRTNDNRDNSASILSTWIQKVKNEYNKIYYNDDSISENLKKYEEHEWNAERFNILGKIRQESIDYAIEHNTDYFVVDCDNFVKPNSLRELVASSKEVIGPFLRVMETPAQRLYSNYHYATDENGYYKDSPEYNNIWARSNPGIHPVDVIHCTYYIKNSVLSKVLYKDNTDHHEYVIFSRNLRKAGIQQYIDNRELYGYLTFATNETEFNKDFTFEMCKELLL